MRVNSPSSSMRGERADSRRNRAALLTQAIQLIAERGPDVKLDQIARSAGVGNATLYRHFPDREALLRAIAVEVIGATAAAAERALAQEPDPYQALSQYLADALTIQVGWVMPAIAATLPPDDAELAKLRARSVTAINTLLSRATEAEAIRADITFGDISLLIIRLARPLPPGGDREVQARVAARHLAIVLAGLRPEPNTPLPGSGLDLAELRPRRP